MSDKLCLVCCTGQNIDFIERKGSEPGIKIYKSESTGIMDIFNKIKLITCPMLLEHR